VGDRVLAARAQAAPRPGDDRAAASPQRADRLHRRVSRRLVVDLASPLTAWRIPLWVVQAIRAALGAGWDVVEVQAPAASDNDGGSGTPEATAAARGAEIYLGYGVPAGVVQAAHGTLKWAHSGTAGGGAAGGGVGWGGGGWVGGAAGRGGGGGGWGGHPGGGGAAPGGGVGHNGGAGDARERAAPARAGGRRPPTREGALV